MERASVFSQSSIPPIWLITGGPCRPCWTAPNLCWVCRAGRAERLHRQHGGNRCGGKERLADLVDEIEPEGPHQSRQGPWSEINPASPPGFGLTRPPVSGLALRRKLRGAGNPTLPPPCRPYGVPPGKGPFAAYPRELHPPVFHEPLALRAAPTVPNCREAGGDAPGLTSCRTGWLSAEN